MKHQVHLETESGGIVSEKTVKQLRMLITELARTVQTLDASVAANGTDPEFTKLLAIRRRNLMITIAYLEDHLLSVVKMQTHPNVHTARPH